MNVASAIILVIVAFLIAMAIRVRRRNDGSDCGSSCCGCNKKDCPSRK